MTTGPVISITDELIAELEVRAIKATPGPWIDAESSELDLERWVMTSDQQWSIAATHGGIDSDECQVDNAKFIAAANPATILALLAERAELKRDAKRYRWLMKELPGSVSQIVMGTPAFSDEDINAAIDAAMQQDTTP